MGMLKNCPHAQHVMDILHLLYTTYHYSCKSRRDLRSMAEMIGVNIRNPTRVRGTRWTPHVEKALRSLLRPHDDDAIEQPAQYHVVLQHSEHLASTSVNADVKGRSKHISKKMVDFSFVLFAHFLLDVLWIIKVLSESLQSNRTILPSAVSSLKNALDRLENLNVRPYHGGNLHHFLEWVHRQEGNETTKFQGIILKNLPERKVDPNDMSSLPDPLLKAMKNAVDMTVDGMKSRFAALLGEIQDAVGPSRTVACFKIFHHDVWPEDSNSLLEYGETELGHLITWFRPILERFV